MIALASSACVVTSVGRRSHNSASKNTRAASCATRSKSRGKDGTVALLLEPLDLIARVRPRVSTSAAHGALPRRAQLARQGSKRGRALSRHRDHAWPCGAARAFRRQREHRQRAPQMRLHGPGVPRKARGDAYPQPRPAPVGLCHAFRLDARRCASHTHGGFPASKSLFALKRHPCSRLHSCLAGIVVVQRSFRAHASEPATE